MNRILCLFCAALIALAAAAKENSAPTNPAPSTVTLEGFHLVGNLAGDHAAFTLTATARVENPKGGTLELLSGPVALTEASSHPKWRIRADQNRFVVSFDRAGDFPIQIKFDAAVQQSSGWKSLEFHVAPAALQPVTLEGLAPDTQFEFPGAARPERKGAQFASFLPADGLVKLSWKESRPEAEGKLFYAAEMLAQISVSPGLMRQTALLDFKIMQGELSRVSVILRGSGEVTRVQGDQVLAWTVEPGTAQGERRLVIQFNQPQKDHFALQVFTQTPLGAFPQTADVLQLRPENATRFAGALRIVNEGAVRLEVVQAGGLSQISPDQFPETEATKAALRVTGSQRFVYRFSGLDFALRIQADQILPELSVSELLAYNLAENELAIDAELEIDIREAPLRELVVRVPKAYAIARLAAAGMSDYFLSDLADQPEAELRLVYAQPISERQIIQLRLEHNQALGQATWALPRIDIPKSKSTRGHLAVSADAGFRLTPERTQSLTEIATAFFPRKVAGIQSAFRLSDAAWQAVLRVERLPQTVQADGFHLFSIGEGIAYGSSIINYAVSGAPVSAFNLELSDEYFNVEFTGKDIRNWQKTARGYVIQLHTPVAGAYTLLATYERPFKAQGETLTFTGARPLDAQSEQGHTLIISAYQFQVTPADVSAGLLPLETAEVPSEYRLFFDAPILAAYRYSARPFNLKLALSPLAQGDSLSQIVDRASLTTHISKEGQILTDVRYFVKNRGNPHFRFTLPSATQLWSASVNGVSVVPVLDGAANLIPLPQHADPNAILTLDLKLASRSQASEQVHIAAPILNAPVMLEEWKLEPDARQRLLFRRGSLTPLGGVTDVSGFAQLARAFTGGESMRAWSSLLAAVGLIALATGLWHWSLRQAAAKTGRRVLIGGVLGLGAFGLAIFSFLNLSDVTARHSVSLPREVAFVAPVQQAGSALTADIENLPDKLTALSLFGYAWPAVLGLGLWVLGGLRGSQATRTASGILGWVLLGWAALRAPNGASAFIILLLAVLVWQMAVPALRQFWRLRRTPQTVLGPGAAGGAAPVITAWLLAGLVWLLTGCQTGSISASASRPKVEALARAESLTQDIRVEDKFALAKARIRWGAEKGQWLPLLAEPAVLTRLRYETNSLKLLAPARGSKLPLQLLAERAGMYALELEYQVQVTKRGEENGFLLPLPFALVNHVGLTLANLDADVHAPQAVSTERQTDGSNTVASLVLAPSGDAWIGWKPRTRDVKREKPVFYAELTQLYAPTAGVIEGAHQISIRPAQGELSELVLEVPSGATITDVLEAGKSAGVAPAKDAPAQAAPGSIISLWRFDPDTRKLRVTLSPPQSRPFTLLVFSEVPTGPLPLEETLGLMRVDNAASQIGLLGVATGNEVQLDSLNPAGLSPINLEDFPPETDASLQASIPGLAVRRAFRYADPKATATFKVSPVEPDVRVEMQNTLSLGEDRTVLAANAVLEITRAGIFRLSFLMPQGFDVESITGSALSHWTELKTDAGRVITLHLTGKTEGKQQFAISLAGPGVKSASAWQTPQLVLREASKQRGTLLVIPEQGMRLQVGAREGLTQLDPQKSGIRQKGVLAFHILQTPWSLSLEVEQVDSWIQVTSLQHASVSEAQVKVSCNLQYQIENTGLKAFHVLLPANAESVNFQGEQLADFLKVPGSVTNELQSWEIKLHRRVIGPYLLQVSYQTPVPEQAAETSLRGIQALGVNLQRGFVTIQSSGRLQVLVDTNPPSVQPAEWQSIPQALQRGLQLTTANYTYRLSEPAFVLPLKIERHEAAKLLPARVNSITLSSVVADDCVMLTRARLELLPGDKRLLSLTLPKDARFWFAYVNQNGVWPWRQQDRILIPLESAQSREGRLLPVEVFYSCRVGASDSRALELELFAPKFDLPLENITWRVSLNDKWLVKNPRGSLQLQREEILSSLASVDLQTYLQNETALKLERTKEAQTFLSAGNTALEQGNPQQARRAFQAAYGLSTQDAAFNEDARVQLHNIKLQQALVGLNVRQAGTAGEQTPVAGKLRDLRARKELNYTQEDAKNIIDRNSADENAAFMRLAERLIQQQDAAVSSPAPIRAAIPEQGRVLTFQRAVLVDPWAELKISLKAKASSAASWAVRGTMLAATLLALILAAWGGKSLSRLPS